MGHAVGTLKELGFTQCPFHSTFRQQSTDKDIATVFILASGTCACVSEYMCACTHKTTRQATHYAHNPRRKLTIEMIGQATLFRALFPSYNSRLSPIPAEELVALQVLPPVVMLGLESMK